MESIFSLHRVQETSDEDQVSVSQVVVGREVASSPNPDPSEAMIIPQSGIPESAYDWSNIKKEFEETLPSSIGHYNRKTVIDEYTRAEFTVPAMQTDFKIYRLISPQTGQEEALPMGWTKHTHSDGKPYFYHEQDKVITEEWLYDKGIAEKVARYISMLKDPISKRSESFGRVKSWHLYVEIRKCDLPAWEGDSRIRCGYYFANHDAECIFWLSKCRLDDYLLELRGKMSSDLIRKYLQKEYWNHHYFFSDLHRLTNAQWNAVKKFILLAETDVTMSEVSTVTSSIDKLKIMSKSLMLAEKLDASEVAGKLDFSYPRLSFAEIIFSSVHDGSVAKRVQRPVRDQILNYHGQRNVRTCRDDSVYGYDHTKEKRTVPFRTINLLLFHAPIKNFTSLSHAWVDRLILKGKWQHLIEGVTNRWHQHVAMAIILLAVNMVFLAIPSVDDKGANLQHHSVTQILCYLSAASNMATIIIGLLLVSHHNTLKDVNVSVATDFLERHWQMNIGFERLSIVYSTPYAFLMWGLIYLLASLFSMCFDPDVSPKFVVIAAFLLGTPFVYLSGV